MATRQTSRQELRRELRRELRQAFRLTLRWSFRLALPLASRLGLSAVALGLGASFASAHEFWLQPHDWKIAGQGQIIADTRVGQGFKGSPQSYLPNFFRRFEIALGDRVEPVEARLGDMPPVDMPALGDGLNVLIHETTDLTLTYSEWEKFVAFARHKAFDGALETHAARGLPDTGFVEAYSRYAKALVAVGDGAGSDRAYGLETEIVALDNPYALDPADTAVRVEVLYQGAPRQGAQVELFEMAPGGNVSITLHQTDAQGRASLPVRAGFAYMADAVVLREPGQDLAARTGAVWETLWANLTFAVPGG